LVEPVLDPHAVGAAATVGFDLLSVGSLQEPEHLFAAETHHRMVHQRRINPVQFGPAPEHDIGGVFAFGDRPVVRGADGPADLGVVRVAPVQQGLEEPLPIEGNLGVEQLLGARQVLNPGKAVVPATILDAGGVQLAGEPFAAVETDLDQKGEPGLEPQVEQAQSLVKKVEVEVHALAPLELEFQFFGFPIAPDKPGTAGFDGAQYGDQAALDPVLARDVAGQTLFVIAMALEVDHAPTAVLGQGGGRLADALGRADDQGLEVLEEELLRKQVILHDRGMVEAAQGGLHAHPIKTLQKANDFFTQLRYKGVGGTAGRDGRMFHNYVPCTRKAAP
jgi:hypothetical protein